MSIRKIAVLGAGNGGCAAAADLTLSGYEVRLFSRSESTIARLAKRGEIEIIEDGVKKSAALHFMSSHLPPVVQGADLIVVAAPSVPMNTSREFSRLLGRRAAHPAQSRPHRWLAPFR
jgi:opine dehydrogenase